MNGLCAPAVMSTEDELALLINERNSLDARIETITARQNKETGITISTMDEVVEYLTKISREEADGEMLEDYIASEWWSKSYNDIIVYVGHYEMVEEPCIKKMLKEHANHILLSK